MTWVRTWSVLTVVGWVLACSSEQIADLSGGSHKKRTSKPTDAAAGDDDDAGTGTGSDAGYTRSIDNSGAHFQVKDIALLKNSITQCVGEGMTKISKDMILPPLKSGVGTGSGSGSRAALALLDDEPKFAFLIPTQTNLPDADIVDAERGNLVDLSNSSRASVASDALTDTYLRSLETVANVIAHNCSADNAKCHCGSKKLAAEMLTRCLPSLDPKTKEMDQAASLLSAICATGDGGMRKAIASMIASFAFASAR